MFLLRYDQLKLAKSFLRRSVQNASAAYLLPSVSLIVFCSFGFFEMLLNFFVLPCGFAASFVIFRFR